MLNPEAIKENILRKMSPLEKWRECLRLREVAWAMKTAFVKSQHPDWDEKQIAEEVKKIFLYANS
jgi:hypothetical protein